MLCSMAPLEFPLRRGFLVPANGLRGSRCAAAAFEALSCGRDRVRWPVPLAVLHPDPRPAVEPAAFPTQLNAAGSLVRRRMDRRGRAKKHGTTSGTGAALRRVAPPPSTPRARSWTCEWRCPL